ncbi:MAG: hypothetical protein KF862_00955 [Chitinophagaceae bacterium]|nr:hypothetical protein [Chitinophagaceae bacterium]
MRKRRWILLLLAGCGIGHVYAQQVSDFDLTFTGRGTDSWSSLPLGNGELSAQAWTNNKGEIQFYLATTDSRDGMDNPIKIGKITISFEPGILVNGTGYSERLLLDQGILKIKNNLADIELRVDASHPEIIVSGSSKVPVKISVTNNIWRNETRPWNKKEYVEEYGDNQIPFAPFMEADKTMIAGEGILWFHRNENGVFWNELMKVNDMLDEGMINPLKNRTSGALVQGAGLKPLNDSMLVSRSPQQNIFIKTTVLVKQTDAANDYINELEKLTTGLDKKKERAALAAHKRWWNDYWSRSYVYFNADDKAVNDTLQLLNRGYILQRYVNAIGARGKLPVKFNGSTLVLDTYRQAIGRVSGKSADVRLWGGAYWWQNTRLIYYPMLASGDFDQLQTFIRFYADELLPVMKKMTKKFYGINGARFMETTHFWGAWRGGDISWNRTNLQPGMSNNPYIKDLIITGLEMGYFLLDYYSYTGDEKMLHEKALPFIKEILLFYDQFYPRDAYGKLLIAPAQSLETYIEGVNPTPDIAGLKVVIPRVMQLAQDTALLSLCRKMEAEIPDIPTKEKNGKKLISPVLAYKKIINVEYPELYPVFPFRIFGVNKADLEVAVNTFKEKSRTYFGWQQTGIQAALLGLTDSAAKVMKINGLAFDKRFRFPGFWGPNYDYTPDQCHAGNYINTIQTMLLQAEGNKVFLLPAWPKEWNVKFKLHAPGNSQVEAEWKNGKMISVKKHPAGNDAEVIIGFR